MAAVLLMLLSTLWPNARGADDPAKDEAAASRRYAVAAGLQTRHLPGLAAEEWTRFLADFPNDLRRDKARHYLGVCLLQDGKYDAAIATLKDFAAAYPRYDQLDAVALNLGVARLRLAAKSKQAADLDAVARTFAEIQQKAPQSPQAPRALVYQAEALSLAGKNAEAASTYSNLIRDYPQSDLVPEAMYSLGVTQDALKQPDQAAATFAGFLQKFPKDPLADECRLREAESLYLSKKYAEAEPLYAQCAASNGFAYADYSFLRRGECLGRLGRFEEAANLAMSLPRKFPASKLIGPARLLTGKAFVQAGKPGPAREALAPLIREKTPETAEAAYWSGQSFLKEKEPAKALAAVEAGLAAQPKDPGRLLLELGRAETLAEIPARRADALDAYARFAKDHPADLQAPRALYLAAYNALRLDRFDAAKAHASAFAGAYAADPLMPEVRFVAAEADLRNQHWAEAAEGYADLVRRWPQSPRADEARVRGALALSTQKKYDEAVDSLTPHLAAIRDPALRAQAQYLIGRARADQGRFEPAITALNASLATKNDWSRADETLLALAHCYRARNQNGEAEAALKRLLQAFPKSPVAASALYLLADAEAARDQLDPALGHYREAVTRAGADDPTAPLARFGVGRTLYRKGDWAGAVEALGDLARTFPKSEVVPRALYARALAERKLKREAEAIQDIQAFLESKPKGQEAADARLVLGLCQASTGRIDDAAKTLTDLVNDQPNDPRIDQVRYELAFIQEKRKHETEAAEIFRRIAATSPTSPLAAEALFRAAEIDYAAHRFAEAGATFQDALAKSPAPALKEMILNRIGWSAYQRGDYQAAAQGFDRQVSDFPAGSLLADGLYMAAESNFRAAQWRPAHDRYLKASRTGTPADQARALYRAGECAGKLKDWSASASLEEELLARFPDFDRRADARYGLGVALQNLDRLNDAIAAYERVVKETETETAAKAQFMIGECLFAQKKHEEAAAAFLKAAYGYPYDEWAGNAHFEAARCFEVLKQIDQARTSYRVLVENYPKHPKARLAAERLKDLNP